MRLNRLDIASAIPSRVPTTARSGQTVGKMLAGNGTNGPEQIPVEIVSHSSATHVYSWAAISPQRTQIPMNGPKESTLTHTRHMVPLANVATTQGNITPNWEAAKAAENLPTMELA